MAPHSSTLAWKIPWTEEPGRLQSMGSLRVGHDWATSLSLFTFMHWRRQWQPTPVFLPGESQGRGSLGGLPSTGSHRVGHDWSDLAADLFEAAASSSQRCSWIHPWVALPPGSTQSAGPHPWPQVGRMGSVSTSEGCVKPGAQYLWLVEFDSKFSNRSITPQMARTI